MTDSTQPLRMTNEQIFWPTSRGPSDVSQDRGQALMDTLGGLAFPVVIQVEDDERNEDGEPYRGIFPLMERLDGLVGELVILEDCEGVTLGCEV